MTLLSPFMCACAASFDTLLSFSVRSPICINFNSIVSLMLWQHYYVYLFRCRPFSYTDALAGDAHIYSTIIKWIYVNIYWLRNATCHCFRSMHVWTILLITHFFIMHVSNPTSRLCSFFEYTQLMTLRCITVKSTLWHASNVFSVFFSCQCFLIHRKIKYLKTHTLAEIIIYYDRFFPSTHVLLSLKLAQWSLFSSSKSFDNCRKCRIRTEFTDRNVNKSSLKSHYLIFSFSLMWIIWNLFIYSSCVPFFLSLS